MNATDRYTIQQIANENCNSVRDHVLASASTAEAASAKAAELASAYHYGVAVVDSQTGLLDVGFGFGVEAPSA